MRGPRITSALNVGFDAGKPMGFEVPRLRDTETAIETVSKLRAADSTIITARLADGGYTYRDLGIYTQQMQDLQRAGLP